MSSLDCHPSVCHNCHVEHYVMINNLGRCDFVRMRVVFTEYIIVSTHVGTSTLKIYEFKKWK